MADIFFTKRRLLGGLAGASLLPLVACGKDDKAGRKLIAVITPSADNPFFKTEGDAAVARAKALGYDTSFDSHDDDAYKQSQLIDVAIAKKAAAIILDNAGAKATVEAVTRAKNAGVGTFLIDREVDARGVALSQIIADNFQGAALGGEAFVKAMGEKGDYVELIGKESDTNTAIRSQGFHSVIDKYTGLKMVARQSANWSQTEAFQTMETILQGNHGIKGVLCGNDTMALGVIAALKAANLSNTVVVGFDGSPDALAAIRAGQMSATVLQPAVQLAQMAVDQAHAWLTKGSTGQPEKQAIPCVLVTKENVDQFGVFARK